MVNWNTYIPQWKKAFFTQIKVIKGEQSGNNTDAVLNNSTDFRSESFKKMIEQHSSA